MKTIKLAMFILYSALFFTLASTQALALSTDRDQPADIEADDIEFDFKKGTRSYNGNVLAVQGTLKIKADKLLANYEDGELKNATAWGSLARFRQRPDGKEHDVEGSAKTILVDQKNNTLTLKGKASLKQGPDTARGDTIIYNMANDTLKVKGGAKIAAKKKPPVTTPTNSNKTGAQQTAPEPQKKLEDPFKEEVKEATPEEKQAPVKTVPSGRSRLIIQPK